MKPRALGLAAAGAAALALVVLFWNGRPEGPDPSPPTRAPPSDAIRAPERLAARWSVSDPRRGSASGGADSGGELWVRVRDDQGRPVAGAEVCIALREREASDDMRAPVCVRAHEEGTHRFGPLLPGSYGVSASARGHQPARHPTETDLPLRVKAEQRSEVELTLAAGGYAVSGRVADALGGGVAGAVVRLQRDWRGPPDAMTLSGPDGSFELWMPEGAASIRATADGYGSDRRFVVAPSSGIELRLTPGATIQGRVRWAETGAPGSHARVTARSDGRGGSERAVLADADGAFSLDGLEPGRYQLSGALPGGFGETAEAVAVGLLETTGPVPIALRPAATVRVHLRLEDGPCADGSASLLRLPGGPFERAESGADGTVELTSLLPGEYRLRARCEDGYRADKAEERTSTLIAGESREMTVVFERGATVRGRVLRSDGSPITRTFVFLLHDERGREASTRVDGNGAFAFRGVEPGIYSLEPRVSWRTPLDAATPIDVPPGGAEHVLVVEETARLEGRVRSGARALAFAEVSLAGDGPGITTVTDGDGRFFFDPVPFGTYLPRVRLHGQSLAVESPERVEIAASDTQSLLVETEASDGVIHGRVVDDGGAPLADVFVSVESSERGRRQRFRSGARPVLTDRNGRFEIGELADEVYVVEAIRPTGGSGRVNDVRIGANVTVTVGRPTLLEGRVRNADGSPALDYTLRVDHDRERYVRSQRIGSEDGAFRIADVPPGRVRLEATTEGGAASLDLALAEGERLGDLELVLEGTASVRGVIVDVETAAPVSGLVVSVSPVWNDRGLWRVNPGRRTRTDASGRFEVPGGVAGPATLVVYDRSPLGYGSTRMRVSLEAGQSLDVGTLSVARERVTRASEAGVVGLSLDLSDAAMETGSPLRILAVTPGSGAADAGLRAGDVIVSVDGIAVTGRNTPLFRTLVRKPIGETLSLGLADGRVWLVEVRAPSSG